MTDALTVIDYEDAPSSIKIRGPLDADARNELRKSTFSMVSFEGSCASLEYLWPFADGITIVHVRTPNFDYDLLPKLPNLRVLYVGAYWKIPWEKLRGTKAEELEIYWDKSYEPREIKFPRLRKLKIIGFNQAGLNEIGQIGNLKFLNLVDSRKLSDLSGCESLPALMKLQLHGAPNLRSIKGLSACKSLLLLHLERLKRIEDYAEIKEMHSLRGLFIRDCADIDSLDMLSRLPDLEYLQLGSTKVIDGDITSVKQIRALKSFAFGNKRHYNWKYADARAFFEQKRAEEGEFSEELMAAIQSRY